MKTTLDLSDDLMIRTRELARKRNTTFRAIVEESLHALLAKPEGTKKVPPLVTFKGDGLAPEFQGRGWEAVRAAIYEGHGA